MAGETPPPAPVRCTKSPTSPKSPKSPKSKSSSPKAGSPEASEVAGILPAQHWIDTAEEYGTDGSDAGSVISSTASLTASILEYRKIHGRTYHSEIGNASYWASNDDQQNESMDINHHVQTLVIGGKFFLAPLDTDKIHKVLDIGTGTGSWALDFADEYPNIEVIGTDVSPIQSTWVPPNLKFEIEDCTLPWTFDHNSIDYVHIRWLIGSIADWEAVYKEAFNALVPGGWLETQEGSGAFTSDDGTVGEKAALNQWGKIFANFGKTIGRPFTVVADGIQRKAMEAAGFVDIQEIDYKTPVGTWPKDPQLKEIGQYTQYALEADMEGYVIYPATAIGWTPEEVTVYAAHVRREIRNPDIHAYYRQKVVYGRKP
ncbi:related to TAM domain methyltransferase [Cephalotrichum gorgonifer]|uniref:Related to TAM domain methyltransferase n=1 Tax=Cephalotrichum gorgonifer TaxID=2041049 RepID=A0AAE8N2R2_9PEZI|nr:related to TAM domain methyltransferase [Cephalotrichum gorgonifer]